MHPETLGVIGLGAIGGSVAWQARRAGVPRVIGYSPSATEGAAALAAGAVTELAGDPVAAARGASLVVLATPPTATLELIDRLAPVLDARAILSDVASVKAPILARAVHAGLADRFVGAHPLAGTHGSGFAAARPDRLRGCVVYVCASGTPAGARAAEAVARFWAETLEAKPVAIAADSHDRQLAWTSHLPQAVAYALAATLAGRGFPPDAFGSGARDTTRLASSSPELWIDILLTNRAAVAEALARACDDLADLARHLAAGDAAALRSVFERAAAFRRGLDP